MKHDHRKSIESNCEKGLKREMGYRKSEEGRYGRGWVKAGKRIPFYWVPGESGSISDKTP